MGNVNRRGLARRACCCCLLLLLLVASAALGADVALGYAHALQSTRAYRQPETLSQTGKKQELWSTPLSREAWPIQSVQRIFFQHNVPVESHTTHIWLCHNMLPKYNLPIFGQIRFGFVIGRR